MSKTPENTVFTTGASPGDVLVGIHAHSNRGLLVEVYQKQNAGHGSRILGHFRVLHPGTGNYSEGIRRAIEANPFFGKADDFIRLVSAQPGCDKCTHVLNANALWKLDIDQLNATLLPDEGEPSHIGETKHCTSCGRTYSDLTLNYCLDDGRPLERSDEVETVISQGNVVRNTRATLPFKNLRAGSTSDEGSFGYIRSAVESFPNLQLKMAQGSNHRIMKAGHNGSIWAYPRHGGLAVTANGPAAQRLYREMERMLGPHFRHDEKGYRYWQVDDQEQMKSIIATWSQL